jgi:hypothetical protein
LIEDITTANLVISGKTSVLVRSGEELIDVLQQGQGVLNVLPLAGVKEEVDARIVEFRPLIATTDLAATEASQAQTVSVVAGL